nr:MAG TPA: hypothetical protein [Bacteriophage sp.]
MSLIVYIVNLIAFPVAYKDVGSCHILPDYIV